MLNYCYAAKTNCEYMGANGVCQYTNVCVYNKYYIDSLKNINRWGDTSIEGYINKINNKS